MRVCISTALVLALLSWSWPATASAQPLDPPRLRRPIAAAWIESGRLLAVANQKSGTVSIVDIPNRKVADEIEVGERLADIAAGPGGGRLFAVDEKRHELILLDRDGDSLRVSNRVPVSPYPVSVAVSPDGSRITVASLWSRKMTILEPNIDLPAAAAMVRTLAEIRLPFAPRKQSFLPDGKRVAVADAFAEALCMVDAYSATVLHQRQMEGQAIHGLAVSFDERDLFTVFQRKKEVRQKYARGTIAASMLAGIRLAPGTTNDERDAVGAGLLQDVLVPFALRQRGIGGRDPTSLTVVDESWLAVTAGGTDQLLYVAADSYETKSAIAVGHRPMAAIVCEQPACVVVVNSLSDSLSLVPFPGNGGAVELLLGPAPAESPADRGEALFYDATLSANGWMSCHSCHTDGHTNGQLADTLGDGTHGTPKRIPTLLGTRLTDKWAWNGEVRELHEQIAKSLENTMHSPNFTPEQVMDLTAYLHTLPFPPPLQPATDDPADQAQLMRGESLFASLGCAKCHVPPLTYTSQESYDVGLADEKGLSKFNPPSLRGVSQGHSFFHDGRAKTLEEVFTSHGHQLSRELSQEELADLLRFLRSL